MQGRIKRGAGIFQDHHFGKWPNCCPPRSEYEGEEYKYEAKDPDMVFEVEWKGRYWDCRADGYGMLRSRGEAGEYGSGSIFVSDRAGVYLVGSNQSICGTEGDAMTAHQGTESLMELAAELEEVAPMIEEFFNHKRAAALMRKTAGVVRRLAPLEPEIDVVLGEH